MDTHEFNEAYDREIEKILASLPRPETCIKPTIQIPVDLREINDLKNPLAPADVFSENNDRIVQHTIELEKVFKDGRWYWRRKGFSDVVKPPIMYGRLNRPLD